MPLAKYKTTGTADVWRVAVAPPALTAEIMRHVFSPGLLFGKRMIVTAVREAELTTRSV